jgi:hypothetical protein
MQESQGMYDAGAVEESCSLGTATKVPNRIIVPQITSNDLQLIRGAKLGCVQIRQHETPDRVPM